MVGECKGMGGEAFCMVHDARGKGKMIRGVSRPRIVVFDLILTRLY